MARRRKNNGKHNVWRANSIANSMGAVGDQIGEISRTFSASQEALTVIQIQKHISRQKGGCAILQPDAFVNVYHFTSSTDGVPVLFVFLFLSQVPITFHSSCIVPEEGESPNVQANAS